ncbi:hypothetical protein I6E29_07320 [Arcanobacterium haemolyticum]|nr:hypothetical protein [Arcanobacterium haemolyticum]
MATISALTSLVVTLNDEGDGQMSSTAATPWLNYAAERSRAAFTTA